MKFGTSRRRNIFWLSIGAIATFLAVLILRYFLIWRGYSLDIIAGILGAVVLLLILEVKEFYTEKFVYGKAQGVYKRKEIFEVDHTAIINTKYKPLEAYESIDSELQVRYLGERSYSIKAFYQLGEVEGFMQLDPFNPLRGSGTYQYVSGGLKDIGTYEMFLNKQKPSAIYVEYKNIVPNGLAEGYETWVWVSELMSEKEIKEGVKTWLMKKQRKA
ncbi:MAG: hypothetical protein IPN61_11615 [Bacteroidetes bacterium]|nr:hypothetical protein [Bacteroidota bacterium]MBK8584460.1 hypothetical protein [Bacteroidota bacterium]MBK9414040.1 hypothetical protein [Bacteroidota bacterium]